VALGLGVVVVGCPGWGRVVVSVCVSGVGLGVHRLVSHVLVRGTGWCCMCWWCMCWCGARAGAVCAGGACAGAGHRLVSHVLVVHVLVRGTGWVLYLLVRHAPVHRLVHASGGVLRLGVAVCPGVGHARGGWCILTGARSQVRLAGGAL